MLIRDPVDLRRILGRRLYDKQEREKLRFRTKLKSEAQLSFAGFVAPPARCPLCDAEFRGRLLCWVCEAFVCRRCSTWSTEGDGRHCGACAQTSEIASLDPHAPTANGQEHA
ncbi:MAG: hypothetical protein JWN04_6603 [Myxococcaceae bacterium]|nr:hypothetical protein [Myxococcaceae bacterium]